MLRGVHSAQRQRASAIRAIGRFSDKVAVQTRCSVSSPRSSCCWGFWSRLPTRVRFWHCKQKYHPESRPILVHVHVAVWNRHTVYHHHSRPRHRRCRHEPQHITDACHRLIAAVTREPRSIPTWLWRRVRRPRIARAVADAWPRVYIVLFTHPLAHEAAAVNHQALLDGHPQVLACHKLRADNYLLLLLLQQQQLLLLLDCARYPHRRPRPPGGLPGPRGSASGGPPWIHAALGRRGQRGEGDRRRRQQARRGWRQGKPGRVQAVGLSNSYRRRRRREGMSLWLLWLFDRLLLVLLLLRLLWRGRAQRHRVQRMLLLLLLRRFLRQSLLRCCSAWCRSRRRRRLIPRIHATRSGGGKDEERVGAVEWSRSRRPFGSKFKERYGSGEVQQSADLCTSPSLVGAPQFDETDFKVPHNVKTENSPISRRTPPQAPISRLFFAFNRRKQLEGSSHFARGTVWASFARVLGTPGENTNRAVPRQTLPPRRAGTYSALRDRPRRARLPGSERSTRNLVTFKERKRGKKNGFYQSGVGSASWGEEVRFCGGSRLERRRARTDYL